MSNMHKILAANLCIFDVAPHEGAWIEIVCEAVLTRIYAVAPHEGAWIEIFAEFAVDTTHDVSLPTRERGLK